VRVKTLIFRSPYLYVNITTFLIDYILCIVEIFMLASQIG
jgi:hypothetical protein